MTPLSTGAQLRPGLPKTKMALLAGVLGTCAAAVNLMTMLTWPRDLRDTSLVYASVATLFTFASAGTLLVLSGVISKAEVHLNSLESLRNVDEGLALVHEAKIAGRPWVYRVSLVALPTSLSVTTCLSGGVVSSPVATVLIGSLLFAQILAPDRRSVWRLLFGGAGLIAATQLAYFVLADYLFQSGFDGLKFSGWSFVLPGATVAFASTVVNSATVRFRHARNGDSEVLVGDKRPLPLPRHASTGTRFRDRSLYEATRESVAQLNARGGTDVSPATD